MKTVMFLIANAWMLVAAHQIIWPGYWFATLPEGTGG